MRKEMRESQKKRREERKREKRKEKEKERKKRTCRKKETAYQPLALQFGSSSEVPLMLVLNFFFLLK
jgi:hypothetical protein